MLSVVVLLFGGGWGRENGGDVLLDVDGEGCEVFLGVVGLGLLWLVGIVGGSDSRPFNKVEVILQVKTTPHPHHRLITLLPLKQFLYPRHHP